jgi:hypothetical protein
MAIATKTHGISTSKIQQLVKPAGGESFSILRASSALAAALLHPRLGNGGGVDSGCLGPAFSAD